jgi:hypothetical protein
MLHSDFQTCSAFLHWQFGAEIIYSVKILRLPGVGSICLSASITLLQAMPFYGAIARTLHWHNAMAISGHFSIVPEVC